MHNRFEKVGQKTIDICCNSVLFQVQGRESSMNGECYTLCSCVVVVNVTYTLCSRVVVVNVISCVHVFLCFSGSYIHLRCSC